MVRRGPTGAVDNIGCHTGGQPCGITLPDGFVGGLNDLAEPHLGDGWGHAVDHHDHAEHLETLEPNGDWYPPSRSFQGMRYMAFGDPAPRMPGPAPR